MLPPPNRRVEPLGLGGDRQSSDYKGETKDQLF